MNPIRTSQRRSPGAAEPGPPPNVPPRSISPAVGVGTNRPVAPRSANASRSMPQQQAPGAGPGIGPSGSRNDGTRRANVSLSLSSAFPVSLFPRHDGTRRHTLAQIPIRPRPASCITRPIQRRVSHLVALRHIAWPVCPLPSAKGRGRRGCCRDWPRCPDCHPLGARLPLCCWLLAAGCLLSVTAAPSSVR